mgnify:FL=1
MLRELGSTAISIIKSNFKIICSSCGNENVLVKYSGDARGLNRFEIILMCKVCGKFEDQFSQ